MNRKIKKAIATVERLHPIPNNGWGMLRFNAVQAARFDWYDAKQTARYLSRKNGLPIHPNAILSLFKTFQRDRGSIV